MPGVIGSVCAASTCAVLGAALGLLLPRVAYRCSVPRGDPPRAGCGRCGRPFRAGVGGWLRLGAACGCPGRPGVAPGWSVLASGLAATVPGARLAAPEVVIYLLAAVFGVLLALIDISCLRLPDPLVAGLAVLVLGSCGLVAAVTAEPGRLGRASLAAVLVFAGYLALACWPGGGLGFGDVKFAAVLGFLLGWLGWPAVGLGVVAAHLINVPVVLTLVATGRAGRHTALPFGPALLAGTLLAIAGAT